MALALAVGAIFLFLFLDRYDMDSIDLEVLKSCDAWLREGKRCELVTVIRTWGSSPRPEGATLAICDDGRVVGSVSGGCIEDDLIAHVRSHGITRSKPEIVTYGITADEAYRFGLPCGGTIELALEPLSAHSRISELLQRLEQHELVARRLDFSSGEVQLRIRHVISNGFIESQTAGLVHVVAYMTAYRFDDGTPRSGPVEISRPFRMSIVRASLQQTDNTWKIASMAFSTEFEFTGDTR